MTDSAASFGAPETEPGGNVAAKTSGQDVRDHGTDTYDTR